MMTRFLQVEYQALPNSTRLAVLELSPGGDYPAEVLQHWAKTRVARVGSLFIPFERVIEVRVHEVWSADAAPINGPTLGGKL